MKKKKAAGIGKEKEYELLRLAKQGDGQAKRELIEAHTPFIAFVIKEFTLPSWVPEEDVLQEGKIGMLTAIELFDMERGLRLCTFAYWHIRKTVVSYLSVMGYPMKVPFPDVIKLKKILNRLDMGLSENPLEDEKFVNEPKNVHILSLILGCVPISTTEHSGYHSEDQIYGTIDRKFSEKLIADPTDSVIDNIVLKEIVEKISEMTVYEGYMLSQYLGIYVTENPVPLKRIAGERSKVVARPDGEIDISQGWNGFGLQIGETYNSVGKLIKSSEAKFRHIIKNLLEGLYDEYMEK